MTIVRKTAAILLFALIAVLVEAGFFDDNVLSNVPATARPVPVRAGIAAVYLSGDVGYKFGMGRLIGDRLAADGIPVVAVNSLGFFRSHRSVPEVAALTARAIRRALAFGHASHVVLIGHSLGADALQAALGDMPPTLRSKISAVVLIVPTSQLYLRISPAEMLEWSQADAEVLPTLRQLTWVPVTCIYGAEESGSPCPRLTSSNVRAVGLPGGHALHWDIDQLHAVILNAIDRTATARITKDLDSINLTAMPGRPDRDDRQVRKVHDDVR